MRHRRPSLSARSLCRDQYLPGKRTPLCIFRIRYKSPAELRGKKNLPRLPALQSHSTGRPQHTIRNRNNTLSLYRESNTSFSLSSIFKNDQKCRRINGSIYAQCHGQHHQCGDYSLQEKLRVRVYLKIDIVAEGHSDGKQHVIYSKDQNRLFARTLHNKPISYIIAVDDFKRERDYRSKEKTMSLNTKIELKPSWRLWWTTASPSESMSELASPRVTQRMAKRAILNKTNSQYRRLNNSLCHSPQSSLADYYRQIHLLFLKGREGSELDSYESQHAIYKSLPRKGALFSRAFYYNYQNYCKSQERRIPHHTYPG